jgi:hypothetical protein
VGPAKIALFGDADLQLPAAQRTEAKSNSPSGVTMTLYCPSDEEGKQHKAITMELTSAMARDLAIRLWLAADESDFR